MTRLIKTQAVLSLIVLVSGCSLLTPTKPETCLITEPNLDVHVTSDRGICLGPDSTADLLKYIEDLERCAGVYQRRGDL